MARLILSVLATLGAASVVAALPQKVDQAVPFSFENWVEDIISNPNGDYMSPEEAVKAWEITSETTGSLNKRVTCRDDNGSIKAAYVCPDSSSSFQRINTDIVRSLMLSPVSTLLPRRVIPPAMFIR